MAHSLLDVPAPRDHQDGYKDSSPCGVTRASSQPATHYEPGQALTVEWLETVDHAGCFVVEFSAQGDQDFQVLGRLSHGSPPEPAYPTSAAPRHWSMPVVLPDVTCQGCTLRLRQIMADEDLAAEACPPATNPPGSIYTTCANLSLGSEGGGTSGGTGGATTAGGTGAVAGGGTISGSADGAEPEGGGCCFSPQRPSAAIAGVLLALVMLLPWRRTRCPSSQREHVTTNAVAPRQAPAPRLRPGMPGLSREERR